jgi:hypothetical protein
LGLTPTHPTLVRLAERSFHDAAAGKLVGTSHSLTDEQLTLPQLQPIFGIAAKHSEFGELEVFLEDDGGYIVGLGNFTHAHHEFEREATKQAPELEILRVANEVVAELAEVISEQCVFFKTRSGGGAYRPRSAPDSAQTRRLRIGPLWTFSGPLPE